MRIKLLQSYIWYGFYLDWVYYFRLMNLGLLKHSKSDQSADSFVPLLIYVILRANPEHLVSNVQYILRFRNQEKLGGEAGYYLSSLVSAFQMISGTFDTNLLKKKKRRAPPNQSKTYTQPHQPPPNQPHIPNSTPPPPS